MNTLIARNAKAVGGALVAGATWFATSFADGQIDSAEWAVLPIGVLTGAGVVYAVRNRQD